MGPGGVWYDFSTGEGGGAIELVQRINNCDCFEAARLIIDNGWSSTRIESGSPRKEQRRTRRRARQALKEPRPVDRAHLPANEPIRQDLIAMCDYHPLLRERGISEATCDLMGVGYLPQGRSPMKGRIVFQAADARPGQSGELERVILSHIGRATSDVQQPKYLFYEGFHKSLELYGQELIWLHEDAAEQAKATGHILLTEGPFDLAMAIEAGVRNGVASFGANLSEAQADKLKALASAFGVERILIAYDRDDAGKNGAAKAAALLRDRDLHADIFDWEAPLTGTRRRIPEAIGDLGDLSAEQLQWLRARGLL